MNLVKKTIKIKLNESFMLQRNYMSTYLKNKDCIKTNLLINNEIYQKDEWTNISESIIKKLDANLLDCKWHPLKILTNFIINHFKKLDFKIYNQKYFSPIVKVNDNFDNLLIKKNHPSRKKSDNFYINKNYMLRAHTTVHDIELITKNENKFIVFGDVYRRDEIDKKHYPVFHQVDGVYLFDINNVILLYMLKLIKVN